MITYKLKKYRYLRATFRAQTVFIKKLGYNYKDVPGNSGSHNTNTVDVFEIQVGKNQSLEDRVITFSHEIGHALDLAHQPMSIPEKCAWKNGISQEILVREIVAWKYGWQLLKDMGCGRYVKDRFDVLQSNGINSYREALETKMLKRNNKKC